MFLAAIVTLLVGLGTLLVLLNVPMTGAFADKAPQGDRAMGLIIPIFATGIGLLLVLAAGLIVALRGGYAWLIAPPGLGAVVALILILGAALAAAGALVLWMGPPLRLKPVVPAVGLVCGLIGPLLLAGFVLVGAWGDHATLTRSFPAKALVAALALVAVCGYAMGLAGIALEVRRKAVIRRQTLAAIVARQAEEDRLSRMSPAERLREQYASWSADAPLWTLVAGLPTEDDAESRRLTIERALQVPNLDWDLERTLRSDVRVYRHGCAEFIRGVPSPRPAWAAPLAASIDATAAEFAAKPDWMTNLSDYHPDPVAHIQALIDAAAALGHPAETAAALKRLAAAATTLPHTPERDEALRALEPWRRPAGAP